MTSAPAARIARRARQDGLDAERGRVDDLGEDAHVVARKIDAAAALAEKRRQILQLLGAALERHAEFGCKPGEIGAATTGHHNPVGIDRSRQPAGR